MGGDRCWARVWKELVFRRFTVGFAHHEAVGGLVLVLAALPTGDRGAKAHDLGLFPAMGQKE
ncbi:hypothetical protein EG19_01025 [Thermoanaerobaculum aquaticum]|uniref:Uncharacterized protein n=1 Tax=Thermoanaerobaculum aquaticum TaxID=1312852 RepID=A0A062Y082_9BACT|nr:hypothetical protein EG19_01025 [Thermoanaerobaculum aquaticum]